jgi:hypothetical protein
VTTPRRGRLRDVVEVSGVLAVVLSLVFVGLELRQTASAVRGAAFQSMTSDAHNVNLARAGNPELNLALRLWLEDADSLTVDQANAAWAWEFAVLRHFENIHRQAELGVLPLEDVDKRLALHSNFDSPRFAAHWTRSKIGFSPSFVAYLDDYLAREP